MRKLTANDPETRSPDAVRENIERLKELFPEVVTEGRIDYDALKQLLGEEVDEREEKYGLNWHGKRRARQLALTPSTGTLRPCSEDSVDWEATKNLMIEGDNLEVLKLLQKSYAGKVKLIWVRLFFVGGRISLCGSEAGGNWIRHGVVREQRRGPVADGTCAVSDGWGCSAGTRALGGGSQYASMRRRPVAA